MEEDILFTNCHVSWDTLYLHLNFEKERRHYSSSYFELSNEHKTNGNCAKYMNSFYNLINFSYCYIVKAIVKAISNFTT